MIKKYLYNVFILSLMKNLKMCHHQDFKCPKINIAEIENLFKYASE